MMRKEYTQPLCHIERLTNGQPIMDLVILRGSAAGTGENKTFDNPNEVF